MRLKINNRKLSAQSTLEQLLMLSVVIAAFIIAALAKNNPFQASLTNTLQERAKWMEGSTMALGDPNQVEPSLGAPP